jgi:cysteine-rich repeat protein
MLACGSGAGASSDEGESEGESGAPTCGDGELDPGEACDDGQSTNHDGCDADCQPSAVVGVVGRACVELRAGAVRCWGPEIPGGGALRIVGDDEPAADGPILTDVISVARGYWNNQAGPPDSILCVLRKTGAVDCRAHADAPLSPVSLPSPAQTIAAYDARACAVTESGELYCWGQCRFAFGAFGSGNGDCLGYGSGPIDEVPWDGPLQPIPVGVSVSDVALGTGHACVISDVGEVNVRTCFTGRCLGGGAEEAIGDDEPASMGVTVPIASPVQLGAIDQTSCALSADGTVRCWGMSADGSELVGGDGLAVDIPLDGSAVELSALGQAARMGDGTVVSWSLGGAELASDIVGGSTRALAHDCALLESGTLRCWDPRFDASGWVDNAAGWAGCGGDTCSTTKDVPVF